MSSFTTSTQDPQARTQRRLLFEGFNVHEPINASRRHHSATMLTSTPDHRLHEKENEQRLDALQTNDTQSADPCLLQLQNARQLLHSMSRTNIQCVGDQPTIDEPLPRTELLGETNPELAYYKSSLESERARRKQLETLIDVQQKRLTDAESELIQLRANDHKKTLCMKQLEQMIPNVVDEWKQKEDDYKVKLTNATQQLKQTEQNNREKALQEKQQFDERINEKDATIERLTKENDRRKQDYDSLQPQIKQYEQRVQQLTKDAEQAKTQWSALESDLRNQIRNGETRLDILRSESDEKQHEIEQMLREHQKANTDHQMKARQQENELDEQRRENNVLKMELELREAKYRAQTESLKIQLMRDAETKLSQRLEEQQAKHLQLEEELNELHRRKLADLQAKHEEILTHERQEHESRVQALVNKLDQTKTEVERIQSTTLAERQDLAKKLQDVFETALFQGTAKPNGLPSEAIRSPPTMTLLKPIPQLKSHPLIDSQVKEPPKEYLQPLPLVNRDHPANMSTIRSLSSRIDSIVDQTNRVASGLEFTSRLPASSSSQPESTSDWIDNNQNRLLSSRPPSALHSPFYRSTPIDPHPRSQSADPTNSGFFSTYPSYQIPSASSQQQPSSNSYSLDSNLNTSPYHQPALPSFRSTSSAASNFLDHQQEVHASMSKDSIDRQPYDQISSNNESLTRYVKMLLERSPAHDQNPSHKHPLARTNQSLHDVQHSLEQLNRAEREPKVIVDDLALNSHSPTPRQQKAAMTARTSTSATNSNVKKRLDYDTHHSKQSNANGLFERLSQPKTRAKKDKAKHQPNHPSQQQPQQQTSSATVWK